MNRRQKRGKLALIIVFLLLVLVFVYSGLQILESTIFYKGQQEDMISSKTITRDGVDYFPRQDIVVFLVMGIDKNGPVESSGSYNNDGEADTVMLMVFDKKEETVSILCLNRDTMLDMPVLGVGGKQAGTYFGQLALAHTYGSGLEDSCENTCKAVSDLLYGITIDYYIAMNIDAISVLNDVVGGVTVNVVDDFSNVDPTITMGKMTLHGEQAVSFVRNRKGLGNELNLSRIDRQKEYMEGFIKALRQTLANDISSVKDLYEGVTDYIVTDCTLNTLGSLTEWYADYTLKEIVSLEGENVKGKDYMEFYLDEEALDELILRIFYAPKN